MSKVHLSLEVQKKGSGHTVVYYTKDIEMDGQPLPEMRLSEEDVVLQISSVQYYIPDGSYFCRLWEQQETNGEWDFLIKYGWKKLS